MEDGASPAIWDHSVTCHPTQMNEHCHNPSQTGQYWFTYPGGMKGWVHVGVCSILRWFTCPQTVTHLSSNHLTVNAWSQIHHPNCYITKPQAATQLHYVHNKHHHQGPQFAAQNFAKLCGSARKIPRLTTAKLFKLRGLTRPSVCA